MVQVAVSGAATALSLVLLVAAVRNLLARDRSLPPQRLPALLANLIGLVAFVAGMAAGRRFWP